MSIESPETIIDLKEILEAEFVYSDEEIIDEFFRLSENQQSIEA